MRADFFRGLYDIMKKDKNVVLLTSDTGAIVLDDIRRNMPERYINVGIAEANMISVAAGLSLCGKIVYVYAIIPFVTLRCFEHYRVDVCCQNLNVKAIGVGAGLDYCTLGPTHHAHEDYAVMRTLPGLTIFSPCDENAGSLASKLAYETPGPVYVRLERYGVPPVYKDAKMDFSKGINILNKGGNDLCIIATGKMVVTAQKVGKNLKRSGINPCVMDLFRIKPVNEKMIFDIIKDKKHVVTIEEHTTIGGIASIVCEIITRRSLTARFKGIGFPDKYCRQYGPRPYLHRLIGLDDAGITESIKEWVSADNMGKRKRLS